ncbi:MAG: DUF2169 domain-containing protein [Minicystis sp.]
MTIANETPFVVQPVPLLDREGHDVIVVIVKGSFTIDPTGKVALADEPSPVRLNDETFDPESPHSSLRYASDLGLPKVGTDVVVLGDAVSRAPVTMLDVAVKVKQRVVPLRVHGPRLFHAGAFGVVIGRAQPFERIPIVYERAYGGMSEDLSLVEARNPSGVGLARSASDLVDRLAPQIEHPDRPHSSASDRHPPVGFGPIMTHWSPRREYAGTFDARWRALRMPLLPDDHDARYGNVAHPSLQFAENLVAGDVIGVHGMSLDTLVFALPAFPLLAVARYDSGERELSRPQIDTVWIAPELRRVELTARAVFRIGRAKRALRELVVRHDD